MVILPFSTSTDSLKFNTMLISTATFVALSVGVDEDKVGAVLSQPEIVKFHVSLPLDVSDKVQLFSPNVPVLPEDISPVATPLSTLVYVSQARVEDESIPKVVEPLFALTLN